MKHVNSLTAELTRQQKPAPRGRYGSRGREANVAANNLVWRPIAATVWLICLVGFASGCAFSSDSDPKKAERHIVSVPLASYGVPPGSVERLQAEFAKLVNLQSPEFQYPWTNPPLDQVIVKLPNQVLPLIGYGSLLNVKYVTNTVKYVLDQGYQPVICVGAKRVFNYKVDQKRLNAKYPGPRLSNEIAALNLIYTKDASNLFNGRKVLVTTNDVQALREREVGYDLRPVACLDWLNWDAPIFLGYALVAKADRTDDGTLPNPWYTQVCEDGAQSVSHDFLELFLDTTYLANQKTTLRRCEQISKGFVLRKRQAATLHNH